jgi:hypothetical protein
MNIKNKKGFGLVMAVMVTIILVVMAAGFFHITTNSAKAVDSQMSKLKLYWLAESASNYNVNWWVNQPDEIRIDWPSTYTEPQSKSKASEYQDLDGKQTYETKFPNADGITKDGKLYLHASSLVEGNTNITNPELENVDGAKLVVTRYKGERAGAPGKAVWILDSYAWDPSTGEYANIVLSNVYNIKPVGWNPLLAQSEAIMYTLAGTGFNGALGAFHEKDVRYGPAYYNDLIRIDYQTGGSGGPRFYMGPVTSSARQSGSTLAQSRYGNPIETGALIDPTHTYGYGLGIRSGDKTQAEAVTNIVTAMNKGATPYKKDEPVISTDGLMWSWDDIVKYGPSNGVYFIKDYGFPTGNPVNVELKYDTANKATMAVITSGGITKTIPVGRGAGKFMGVAVTKDYKYVTLKGVSGHDFTMATENNPVHITDHFYVAEMEKTKDDFLANLLDIAQNNTKESRLAQIWADMMTNNSKAHLGVLSCMNSKLAPQYSDIDLGSPWFLPNIAPVFSTSVYVTWDGHLSLSSNARTNSKTKLVNVGSFITLSLQNAYGGDPSGKWSKVLIQDQRYLDPEHTVPPMFGPSPGELDPLESITGLNPKHRYTRSLIGKNKSWQNFVWSRL